MQATVEIPRRLATLPRPEAKQEPRILLLSSSLLTDRMLQHTQLLEILNTSVSAEVWAMSARNPRFKGVWGRVPTRVREFPEFGPFREIYNYARRLNEFVWDYHICPPSRLSMARHVRNKTQPRAVRALKLPARALAALRLETVLENRLEKLLLSYQRSPQALEILRQLRPSLVVTTGPQRYEEPAIVSAAKQLGIPVLAFIASWDNISTKGRLVFKYDGYLLWSENMRSELHHFYPQSREVPSYIVGAPQFDVFFQDRFRQSRAEFCAAQGLQPDLPIVLYAVGSPNFIRGEYDGALEMAKRVTRGELGDVQLLVRPHPIHDKGELRVQLAKISPRIVVQRTADADTALSVRSQDESQIVEWVNTFLHANVVVNLFSTVSIDAAIFDRPVVNLDYDPEPGRPNQALVKDVNHRWTHFKPIAESGGMWMAENPDEVIQGVKTYLEHPDLHREGRRWIADFVCGYIDGRCGQRMADAVIEFAKNQRGRQNVNVR
jgi:CDP-Glycerol:Poly(glycerophosphate) glycerophosphotransferase